MCIRDSVKGDSGKFPDYGEVLAFPGAEGFGRYATGAVSYTHLDVYKRQERCSDVTCHERLVVQ